MSDPLPEKPRPEADLHRISINAVLLQKYAEMQAEYSDRLRTASRFSRNAMPYSSMAVIESMAVAQAAGFPDVLNDYRAKRSVLDLRFGDPGQSGWELRSSEADLRKQLLESLLYALGSTKIDERPQSPESTVKNYAFSFDGRQLLSESYNVRLSQNRNLNVLITGKMGSGKSYGALSVGQYVNPDLNLDTQLSYGSVSGFVQATRTLPAGRAVIFDEVGLDAGSRDPMSNLNKILSKLLQSTRYRNLLSIFTCPDLSLIDKSVRILSDLILEHSPDQRQGEFTPLIPEVLEGGKIDLLSLKRKNSIVRSVFFPLPSPEIVQKYEIIRSSVNGQRLAEMQEKLESDHSKETDRDGRGRNENSLRNLKRFSGGEKNEEIDA